MIYARGTFTGKYMPSEPNELLEADSIIINEFAIRNDGEPGAVNEALARFAVDRYSKLGFPVFCGPTVEKALERVEGDLNPYVFDKVISADTTASTGGTWEELMQIKRMMGETGLNLTSPIIVAQAHHVGRVAMQAVKAGLQPLIPLGLPSMFDPESSQWWCRREYFWALRELIGAWFLRSRGQL